MSVLIPQAEQPGQCQHPGVRQDIGGVLAEEQRREERPQKQDDVSLQGHMPLEKVHAGRSFPVKFS